jgi:UDP:flavonoid glycosyltransferase YjiC (YdhE family)
MRVLLSTWGWRSHFYPLVPLAWAIRAAGHELLVATQPSLVPAVTTAGLPAVGLGADLDFVAVFTGLVGRVGTRAGAAATALRDRVEPAITADGGVARYAEAALTDLIALGRRWRPDLVLFEPGNLAAAVAAAALGVPGVRHLWGPDAGTELDLDRDAVLGPLADRAGVPTAAVDLAGALTVDPCPAALQAPAAGPGHPIRHLPYNGPAVLPDWLAEPPRRPRIAVTGGTMMPALGLPDRATAPAVLRALAELDVEVVVALDPAQLPGLGPLPASVRVVTGLALHLLAPGCQLLVHQGGNGTLMTGVAAGLPQLVLPRVSDQHFNAERLAATGAGIGLDTDDPAAVRDRAAALLADPAPRAAAADLCRAVAAAPSPAEVVPRLVQLCP